MQLIYIQATVYGYGGDKTKEKYDIGVYREFDGFDDLDGTMRLGRMYHATSAAGWHCPVMFVSYRTMGRQHMLMDLDLIIGSIVRNWGWLVRELWLDARHRLRMRRSA